MGPVEIAFAIDDPSQFEPIPLPTPTDPLQLFSDDELERTLLSLRLVCGRNKSVFKKKNRTHVCALWRVLDAEKRRRAIPDVL